MEDFKLTGRQETALKHIEEALKKTDRNRDYVSFDTYEKIFDKLGDLKGKVVIDVGAGLVPVTPNHAAETIFLLPIIEDKGATYVPIDVVHKITRTWNLFRDVDEKLSVEPATADAFKLPFKDESIDGCVSANLINFPWHILKKDCHERAFSLLAELFRVTKEGGFVIITSFGYVKCTNADGRSKYNNDIPENQILTPSEIKQLALHAGFKEVGDISLDNQRLVASQKRMQQIDLQANQKSELVGVCAFLLKK